MARTLLLYSTVYGLSRTICERIQTILRQQGRNVDVAPLADGGVDPAAYDAIVIGASVKHGKHQPAVIEFIRKHQSLLESRPSALFSVNLVARKPNRNTPETNTYLQKLLAQIPWKPKMLAVFAGELDYSRYSPIDKHMMRFVMWLNKGPTDFSTKVQFTDWKEVERFAARVAAMTETRPNSASAPAAVVA